MKNEPMPGDVWKDRGGTHFTVEKVLPDGGAILVVPVRSATKGPRDEA